MAEALKILGQVAPIDTNNNILYTVPALTMSTISSVVVCNRTATAATFRISVAANNASDDVKQYLFYDQELDANSTYAISIGITLTAGDVVRVRASAINALSFNIFGVEVN